MKELYTEKTIKNKQNHYEHITKRERDIISKHLSAGKMISYIAKALNRSKSSICEEIKRGWYKGKYVASIANDRSLAACKKSHNHTKWRNTDLQHFILMCLKEKWAPEIIAHIFADLIAPLTKALLKTETKFCGNFCPRKPTST